MNEDIIIDGYNLIRQSEKLSQSEANDLEAGREHLISLLCSYKRIKRKKIAVVFDGWKSGRLSQRSYFDKGIKIIFSKLGQRADEVIKRISKESGKELIVVTSDNDIKLSAEKNGNVVISSHEFLEKIEMAEYSYLKGMDNDEDEIYHDSNLNTKKRGNPRKLSKNERKKKRHIKKL